MKIRTLESLRRPKSEQFAEKTGVREGARFAARARNRERTGYAERVGRRLRFVAKVAADAGLSGDGAAGRGRRVLQGTIFGCEHGLL